MTQAKEVVVVDGSVGEGGGQILRTALMLSVITGKTVEIKNIRAKRPTVGLRAQHVAALKAFKATTSAEVLGGDIGSTSVRFVPGRVATRDVLVDVGTAGSTTLILSTLVPALSIAGGTLRVTLKGGTDTKWSPTFDYFSRVTKSLYNAQGTMFELVLTRRGYFPVGGGEVVAEIAPSAGIHPIKCVQREEITVDIESVCAGLGRGVAERQAQAARETIEAKGVKVNRCDVEVATAASPGTSICIIANGVQHPVYMGGDSVGERRVRAEEVGRRAAANFLSCYSTGSGLDVHSADMAIPLLFLADGESEIGFPEFTGHVESNLYVASLFTPKRIIRGKAGMTATLQFV